MARTSNGRSAAKGKPRRSAGRHAETFIAGMEADARERRLQLQLEREAVTLAFRKEQGLAVLDMLPADVSSMTLLTIAKVLDHFVHVVPIMGRRTVEAIEMAKVELQMEVNKLTGRDRVQAKNDISKGVGWTQWALSKVYEAVSARRDQMVSA